MKTSTEAPLGRKGAWKRLWAELKALSAASSRRESRSAAALLHERLAPLLPLVAADPGGFWSLAEEHEKREITRLLLSRVVARCTPAPAPRPWTREVVQVRCREGLG